MTGAVGGAVFAAAEARGSALASWTPLWSPADPEFVAEQQYLQREADQAGGWLARVVYALVAVLASAWTASLTFADSRIARDRRLHQAEGAAERPRLEPTVAARAMGDQP